MQRTKDFTKYKSFSRSAKAATWQQRQSEESRLIFRGDKRAFYSYIRRNKSTHEKIILYDGNTELSDSAAANLFLREFFSNFTAPACQPIRAAITSLLLELNCNTTTVIEALRDCSNSKSSPDGIGFKLLKHITKFIMYPLTVIYRYAFYDEIFPSC